MKAAIREQTQQAKNQWQMAQEKTAQERRASAEQHEAILKAQSTLKVDEERLSRERASSIETRQKTVIEQENLRLEKERFAIEKDRFNVDKDRFVKEKEDFRWEQERFTIEKDRFYVDKDRFAKEKEDLRVEQRVFENSKNIYIKALQEKERLLEDQYKEKTKEVVEMRTKLVQHQDMLKKAEVTITKKAAALSLEEESFSKKMAQAKDEEEGKKAPMFDAISTLALLDEASSTVDTSTPVSPLSPVTITMHDVLLEPLTVLEPVPYLDQGFFMVPLAGETEL